MKLFFVLSVFLVRFLVLGQNHLVNYHNSYSEVYGGMEDGGIQRTESYCFAVKKSIELIWFFDDDKSLQLIKGDTLIIHISIYKPYNQKEIKLDSNTTQKFQMKVDADCFEIHRDQKKVYANLKYNCEWNKTIEYIYNKKKYSLTARQEFDSGYTGYAP